jgi:hypothetical protein
MDRLMDFTAALSILLAIIVLVSIRRAHIRVEYSVGWLIGALLMFLISRSPRTLASAASALGVSYAPLVLAFIGGFVFLVIFYRFSVIISRLKDDNIALAQRVAILEFHLNALQGKTTAGQAQ